MLRTRSAASPRPATATTTRRAVAASTLALIAVSTVAAVAPSHAASADAPAVAVAAPANPARAFSAASSVVALQAASLKVVKAQQDAQQDKAKTQVASARGAQQASRSQARVSGSPRAIGRSLAADKGWGGAQFACLDKLWTKESNWTVTADNPTSSAYGIPQALPGSKMGTVASDWRTNPATQIAWGLNYIKGRYGNPGNAWAHSQSVGWY